MSSNSHLMLQFAIEEILRYLASCWHSHVPPSPPKARAKLFSSGLHVLHIIIDDTGSLGRIHYAVGNGVRLHSRRFIDKRNDHSATE